MMMMRFDKAMLLALCAAALSLLWASAAAAEPTAAPGGTAAGAAPSSNGGVDKGTPAAADPAVATVFGPGFFGRRTACGTVLGPATVGVAHRTLPCGTRLEVHYGGRSVLAPVIDRGPYVVGVTWDLTSGAAAALRFPGRGYVATVAVGRGPVPAS